MENGEGGARTLEPQPPARNSPLPTRPSLYLDPVAAAARAPPSVFARRRRRRPASSIRPRPPPPPSIHLLQAAAAAPSVHGAIPVVFSRRSAGGRGGRLGPALAHPSICRSRPPLFFRRATGCGWHQELSPEAVGGRAQPRRRPCVPPPPWERGRRLRKDRLPSSSTYAASTVASLWCEPSLKIYFCWINLRWSSSLHIMDSLLVWYNPLGFRRSWLGHGAGATNYPSASYHSPLQPLLRCAPVGARRGKKKGMHPLYIQSQTARSIDGPKLLEASAASSGLPTPGS